MTKSRMTTPLPRFRRARGDEAEALPRLLLQHRDYAILSDLLRYRLLSTGQIETLRAADQNPALRFPSRLTLTRRLKLLFHHGHVQRIARPQAQGSLEPVYMLEAAGVKALRRHRGEEIENVRSSQPRALALEHLLSINQFRLSLEVACRVTEYDPEEQRSELLRWHSSDEVKFSVSIAGRGERTQIVRLIPDGFFSLRSRGQRLFYFLEVDRGTESLPILLAKCRAYYAYWQGGGFGRDFSLSPQVAFRVLFVLHSPRRLESMRKAMTALPHGRGMFWMASQDSVTPATLLQPVFSQADDEIKRVIR